MILRPAIIGLGLAAAFMFALVVISDKSEIGLLEIEEAVAPSEEQLPPVLFPMFPASGFLGADEIEITVSPLARDVSPGGKLSYQMNVQNLGNETLHDLTVEERYDSSQLIITKALGSRIEENRLTWEIPLLHPGQMWTAHYEATVQHNADIGSLDMTAYVLGDDVIDMPSTSRMVTSNLTVVALPEAGAELNWFWRAVNEFLY